MCDLVCPIKTYASLEITGGGYVKAYGGWYKNADIRFDSSSGGAFTLLANAVIEQGGIVYGCILNDSMRAVHVGVDKKEDLGKLRGSKYVQSELGNVFSEVKKFLETGRKVLFVGTPCQIAGLNSYLGERNKSKNLYKVDFICHGVPSPKVFESHIKHLEKQNDSKVVSFRFRNKDHGWNSTGIQLGTEAAFMNGKKVRKYPAYNDSYMNGFLDDLYLRPSCYSCSFKKIPKGYADFTIADFWGVNKVSKNLDDKKGTSLVLVHNEHANKLWDQVKHDFYFKQVDFERAVRRNKSLYRSAGKNHTREEFFNAFDKKGYSYAAKKYMSAYIWFVHKLVKMAKDLLKR